MVLDRYKNGVSASQYLVDTIKLSSQFQIICQRPHPLEKKSEVPHLKNVRTQGLDPNFFNKELLFDFHKDELVLNIINV